MKGEAISRRELLKSGLLLATALPLSACLDSAVDAGTDVDTGTDEDTSSGADTTTGGNGKGNGSGGAVGTITSARDGNWLDGSTWVGGKVPGSGNAVIQNHNLVVNGNVTVGTSGATGTPAITCNAANRTLTINGGCRLVARGDIIIRGSFGVLTWCLDVLAGGELEFDSSAAANPAATNYCVRPAEGETGASIRFQGTLARPCVVLSNAGGGNGWFSRHDLPSHGHFSATWTNFTRIGDATRAFLDVFYGRNGVGQSVILANCLFDSCSTPTYQNGPADGGVVDYRHSSWRDSTGGPIQAPFFVASGTKNLQHCVFDKELSLGDGAWDVSGSIFLQGVAVGSRSIKVVCTAPVLIRKTLQATINGWGDLTGSYYLKDVSEGRIDNPHFWAMPAWADSEVSGNVFEYNGPSTSGDLLSQVAAASPRNYAIRHNVMVPNAIDRPPGKFISIGGGANASIVIEHNTYISDYAAGGAETGCQHGESGDDAAGMVDSFRSNLAFAFTPNRALLFGRYGGTVQDAVAEANIDRNATWNGYRGSDGLGYHSVSAGNAFSTAPVGGTDVALSANPFVDVTRNLASWGASLGGDGTYRGVLAELAKMNDRSGYDPRYNIAAAVTWVREGFRVTAPALRNAGHDGTTIGAVP